MGGANFSKKSQINQPNYGHQPWQSNSLRMYTSTLAPWTKPCLTLMMKMNARDAQLQRCTCCSNHSQAPLLCMRNVETT